MAAKSDTRPGLRGQCPSHQTLPEPPQVSASRLRRRGSAATPHSATSHSEEPGRWRTAVSGPECCCARCSTQSAEDRCPLGLCRTRRVHAPGLQAGHPSQAPASPDTQTHAGMREGDTRIITLERNRRVTGESGVFPGNHLIVQVLADAEQAA